MGLFVMLHGMKYYYERYFCVLLSWTIIKCKWQCFSWFCKSKLADVVRLWEISRFCHSRVEFHFAVSWYFHLVGICGKLQPSICGKVAEKGVDIFWILLNKMWKIVDTNVDNSKLFLWNYRDLRSHDFTRSASGYALAAKCIHFFMTSWCIWVQHRPWISPRAARKYIQYITPFS